MAATGGASPRPGWQRLGHLIGAERGRRRWSVVDLARRSSLSPRTIEYLEGGTPRRYRDSTLGKIEDAFGWRPGTVSRIVDGALDTDTAPDPLLDRVISRWPYLSDDERRAIAELLDTFTRRR